MRIRAVFLLFLIGSAGACLAQTAKAELGLNYNWMYSNRPPGGDSTFSLNGGSASLAWNVNQRFAVVSDIGAVHASDVPTAGKGLTITSYLVGPRCYVRRKVVSGERQFFRPTPYGQLLLGGAHAGGSLSGSTGGSSNTFAMKVGGGIEMPLNRTVVLRPVQTEYFLTLFPNGTNNRQNNFLFSTGVVFRVGRP
jgi:hypothetical protein